MTTAPLVTVERGGKMFESIYGYVIEAYTCECHEHRSDALVFHQGYWQVLWAGIAYRHNAEQSPREMRAAHRDLKPLIPENIQALMDQIAQWEMRALRAEAIANTKPKP